jgi:hypothetical protein
LTLYDQEVQVNVNESEQFQVLNKSRTAYRNETYITEEELKEIFLA